VLFASDLIEHDGDDLRDLPLIDWSLRNMPAALSVRERAKLHHSRMRPPLLMKA
jgi:hypothetical protein